MAHAVHLLCMHILVKLPWKRPLCLLAGLFTIVVALDLSPLATSTFIQQVNGLVQPSTGKWRIPTGVSAPSVDTSIGKPTLALI